MVPSAPAPAATGSSDDFYPALPPIANDLIAFAYCAFSLYCAYYMNTEYMALGLQRAGAWNATDMIMGGGRSSVKSG
jgi:hypothetical protein